MPATPQDRLYGLTTSVAVKPPVFISADYDIVQFGEQTITSSTPTGDRTVTTTEGMRILLMGQDNPVENGIWVARRSFWVRAPDFNGPRDAVNGTLVFSITGDCWQVEADDPVVIGKSVIHFRPTYPFEANLDIFQRTLRVPEASVSVLPSAEERAWKGLGFDGAGQPKLQDPAGTGLWGYVPAIGSFEKGSLLTQRFEVLLWESTDEYWRWDGAMPKIVLPGSTPATAGGTGKGKWIDVTDATLRANLASSEGLGLVGQCSSLAELRNVEFLTSGQQIFVAEHTIGMGQGGGIFYCHSLTNDDGLIDDNGFQIINNFGQVIRRKDRSRMSAEMFGAIGGQDVMPVLLNIRKASITFNRAVCYFPPPANGINYLHTGGFVVDVTQGYGLCIVCESTDEIDVPFDHIGDNIAFTFKRDNAAAGTAFYKQSGITGALIRGRNSDNTAAGNGGFAVRVSDIIKAKVNVFVNGYTNIAGAAISLYNDTGYTEKSRIKATIRGCCNGVLIHRNAAEGATSTNSFMGTHLDIEYQAGVPGKANKGVVVGNIDGTTTSNTFDINFYASNISLKYWAEAGSITNGIYVGSKAIVPESTTVDLISDGYGFSTSDTDTTTIAATNLIRVENGGIFRAKCMDQSMQTGLSHRLNQLQRLRNSIFSFQDDTYKVPYTDARPYINPVGMSCICSGTIDVATQQAGSSWLISGLPMGMRIKVTINQYLEGESVTSVQEVWEVLVRGDAQSVICTPLVTNDVLTTTTSLAVINSSFATASFLKSVAAAFGKFWQGDSTRTRLTVRNNNDDNSLTTGASDGRKFRIFLPVNASATSVLHYSVKLEVV